MGRLFAAFLAALALSGCSHGDESLANANMSLIEHKLAAGVMTEGDAQASFGPPRNVGNDKNGNPWWRYDLSEKHASPIDYIPVVGMTVAENDRIYVRSLLLIFDKQGVLKNWSYVEALRQHHIGL